MIGDAGISPHRPRPALRSRRLAILAFKSCLAVLVLSPALILIAGWVGGRMTSAGHTASRTMYEIVIGNDVLQVPANAIRFKHQRRNGVAERLDLYLLWPDLEGYTEATRDDFDHLGGSKHLIFLGLETRIMSRDMSARFGPVYSRLLAPGPVEGPGGTMFHRFKPNSGYSDEVLAVARDDAQDRPFVARCLAGEAARLSLAPCERDVAIGDGLSLVYRFPAELLADWRRLDAGVRAKALSYVRTLE